MADRRGIARTRAAAPFIAAVLMLCIAACTSTPTSPPTPEPSIAATIAPSIPPETSIPSVEITPAPTTVAAAPACTAADLKASHDIVEGAAGSRLTTVVLVAQSTCSVDLYPAMGLRDANGSELVGSTSGGAGKLDLDPEISYSSAVRLANWCNPEPAFPVALVVRLGAAEVPVTGSSFPDQGDMPPCNGSGGPVLESGPWEAIAP
jgi:Domain of unknown function (DUF4232)